MSDQVVPLLRRNIIQVLSHYKSLVQRFSLQLQSNQQAQLRALVALILLMAFCVILRIIMLKQLHNIGITTSLQAVMHPKVRVDERIMTTKALTLRRVLKRTVVVRRRRLVESSNQKKRKDRRQKVKKIITRSSECRDDRANFIFNFY